MIGDLGRLLIIVGVVSVVIGLALVLAGRIPGLGHLPGDIVIERENFRLYIPLGSMILISIVLSILFDLLGRWLR